MALDGDDFGNTLGRCRQNIVGTSKSLIKGEVTINLSYFIVAYDQGGVAVFPQLLQTFSRLVQSLLPFE